MIAPDLASTRSKLVARAGGIAEFDDHWTKDLDRYFPEGMDTPGIVMIPVSAKAIRYWDGSDESPLAV